MARAAYFIPTTLLCCLMPHAFGESLSDVYKQALTNDPTLQQAKADWQSANEALPQARSLAFPNIEVVDNLGKEKKTSSDNTSSTDNISNYTLTLTQPVFDFGIWKGLKYAKSIVKSSNATYFYKQQDLIQRTASAYFQVLEDIATLQNTQDTKKQYYQQMITNQEKYKVGLIPIVQVYSAQSSYDTQSAQEIADENTLQNDIETLSSITNHNYTTLSGINETVPLIPPTPNDIDQWVTTATEQNYVLKSAQYAALAQKEAIGAIASLGMPSIAAVAVSGYSNTSTTQRHANAVGLALTYDPFQGGSILAQTKQAREDYVSDSARAEYYYRDVIQNTRTAFQAINSSIQSIKANKQAVATAEQSYKSTQAGYSVGTKTIEDILAAIATLSSTKQAYTAAQYTYLNAIISLKEAAGTLSQQDIEQVSSWLNKPTNVKSTNTTSNTSYTKSTTTSMSTTPHYTIQLFASKDLTQAKNYIKHLNKPSNQYTIIQVNDWYKVTYQQYNSHKAAQHILPTLTKIEPKSWIYLIPNTAQTIVG